MIQVQLQYLEQGIITPFFSLFIDKKDDYIDLLLTELMMRGLSVEDALEELRERLLKEIMLENRYRANLQKLAHCSARETCIIALLHKMPCILHCESHIRIKLLTMVLMNGFSNALQKKKTLILTAQRNESKHMLCR